METVRLAIRSILRNSLRSFLTVLGIVIGVAAVIAMVTVGQGSTDQVTQDIAKLGTNLLMIWPEAPSHGRPSGSTSGISLNLKDVDAIEQQIRGVRVAAPTAMTNTTVVFGNQNHTTAVQGTDNRYLLGSNWTVTQGREFHDSELASGAARCIIGATVKNELFGAGDPLGATLRVKQIACQVIGVLEEKGVSSFGNDQDDLVLMPIRAFQRRISGSPDVNMIYASVKEDYSTDKVKADIERLMRERRRVQPGEEDNFSVMDMKQITSMLTGITTVLTGLLSAVAAVSLLVGGIGIMNIMLVSVTERTREIGIRLAIGATERQVLVQFLVESIVLSLFGGCLGVVLGLTLGWIGANALRIPFTPTPGIIVLAFAFSAAVGVIFGFFPARRAARMDPIEALRYQ